MPSWCVSICVTFFISCVYVSSASALYVWNDHIMACILYVWTALLEPSISFILWSILWRLWSASMHVYSNAGLPNAMGRYNETSADMTENYKAFFKNGWLIVWLAAAVGWSQHTSSLLARGLPSTSLTSSLMLADQRCNCLDWAGLDCRTWLLMTWYPIWVCCSRKLVKNATSAGPSSLRLSWQLVTMDQQSI